MVRRHGLRGAASGPLPRTRRLKLFAEAAWWTARLQLPVIAVGDTQIAVAEMPLQSGDDGVNVACIRHDPARHLHLPIAAGRQATGASQLQYQLAAVGAVFSSTWGLFVPTFLRRASPSMPRGQLWHASVSAVAVSLLASILAHVTAGKARWIAAVPIPTIRGVSMTAGASMAAVSHTAYVTERQ